jgi:hypothetical protein
VARIIKKPASNGPAWKLAAQANLQSTPFERAVLTEDGQVTWDTPKSAEITPSGSRVLASASDPELTLGAPVDCHAERNEFSGQRAAAIMWNTVTTGVRRRLRNSWPASRQAE